MALKQKGMVHNVRGNTQLTLTPPSEEGYVVRDIHIYNPSADYVTINTGPGTVGYFRIGGTLGNHLPFIQESDATPGHPPMTVLGLLEELGIFAGYPVPSGVEFSLTGVHQANALVEVVYDIYDESDVRADLPNGPKANERVYVNYGNTGASITTPATDDLDTQVNPSEFPDFPYDKAVPSLTQMDLLGILASTFAPVENDGTDYIGTQFLKLTKNQTIMADKDRAGYLFEDPTDNVSTDNNVGEGYSIIGNYDTIDHKKPLLYDPPVEFGGGEKLLIQLTTAGGGSYQTITTAEQEVGVILRETRTA